jgi:hypothetical protein
MIKPKPLSIDSRPWCELRAHDRVIRYRCSGSGAERSLLVLTPAEVSPYWAAVVAGLDGRFRVITPEAPPEATDLSAWLAALLEGLGTSVIRVVAGDRFHMPALEVANGEPDQVACVVLVSESAFAALEAAQDGRVPVLHVHANEPPSTVGERLMDFLTRDAAHVV